MISSDAIEKKSRNAFGHVKKDILNLHKIIEGLQNDLNQLKANDLQLTDQLIVLNQRLQSLKTNEVRVVKQSPRIVYKSGSKSASFVAAKGGKKFHRHSCPFAKNILPKKRLVFKTKDAALNNGFKECKCLLR